jgi:hypothetical protein
MAGHLVKRGGRVTLLSPFYCEGKGVRTMGKRDLGLLEQRVGLNVSGVSGVGIWTAILRSTNAVSQKESRDRRLCVSSGEVLRHPPVVCLNKSPLATREGVLLSGTTQGRE